MGQLKKWRDQKWVRIGTDGKIKGECGTSKNKKKPDRCLPLAKARSLSNQKELLLQRKRRDQRKQWLRIHQKQLLSLKKETKCVKTIKVVARLCRDVEKELCMFNGEQHG